ncbi:uncharacterized protein Osi11 [Anabrus simplex]|uniref:uncharacterized protein Osi11 n=1 Tax=Anabrus simplex TaxID=316456 RepID=UPI0035A27518
MSRSPLFIVFAFSLLSLYSVLANPETSEETESDSFLNGLKVLYNAYQNCEKQEEMSTCLKLRALKFADRALKTDKVPLLDGISLVKTPEDTRDGRKMAEPVPEVDESTLPQDPDKKQETLDEMLLERASKFFRSHTLEFSVPRSLTDELGSEDEAGEEGRTKRLKKYGGALLLGLMMKGGLMAMAYKGVALLAGKALMVAKMALVLSAVVALKKLVGGGGGEEKVTYEIVKHPHVSHSYSSGHDYGGHYGGGGGGGGHYESSGSGGGGHYKRSLDEQEAARIAQLMAYREQIPEQQVVQPQLMYPQ